MEAQLKICDMPLVGYDEVMEIVNAGFPGFDEPEFNHEEKRAMSQPKSPRSEKNAAPDPIKYFNENAKSSIFPMISRFAEPGRTFTPETSVEEIYEALKFDHAITEFAVLDGNTAVGLMTRTALNELLGGRYGFWLYSKKPIGEVINADFLKVSSRMTIDYVTKLSMLRPQEKLYDPIVVEDEIGYRGTVAIKDLLNAYSEIEVEAAISKNPLTKLPGNMVIESELLKRIINDAPYCIIYIDIDNFKAYNDAYGFKNGDLILKFVADTLTACALNGEFVGHIGGDDYIIICDCHDGKDLCRRVIQKFESGISSFYRDTDLNNGFIVSTNRHGVVDSFPIASLSIAGISNKHTQYREMSDFSDAIAHLKKKCKKQSGNYFEII